MARPPAGDRALVVDPAAGRRMRRRLDLLPSEFGLDRERMRGWAIAHCARVGIEPTGVHEAHIECARLLLDA